MQSRYLPFDWPLPPNAKALHTTRYGGYSGEPFKSFNLAKHVGDDEASVEKNRQQLSADSGVESIFWLNQVHGTCVAKAHKTDEINNNPPEADAAWTDEPNLACAILVADCMPVLISDMSGSKVGAAHAGWRGLCAGVIPKLMDAMQLKPEDAMIWLGPAIGQPAFEVGPEVLEAFKQSEYFDNQKLKSAFDGAREDRLHADLQRLAMDQLNDLGCEKVSLSPLCTYDNEKTFFSYRREAATGRMAALIWINKT